MAASSSSAAEAVTIRKAYADSPRGQIHYRYTVPTGNAITKKKRPILFLHMSASSSAAFEPLMRIYTTLGYPCYAPDMPGFGGSFDPCATDPPSGLKWYVDLYLGAFPEVFSSASSSSSGDGGCHILGHHSGGCIGLDLAVRHPQLVKSLAVIGPVLMTSAERAAARRGFQQPGGAPEAFNEPVADGSHLVKTWEYLQSHGGITASSEIDLLQREALDHIRAWRGRLQIYSCVFADEHDGMDMYRKVKCPLITMCARDDVLWDKFGRMKGEDVRPDVEAVEVGGANFSPCRDVEGVAGRYTPFLERVDGV